MRDARPFQVRCYTTPVLRNNCRTHASGSFERVMA